MQIIPKLPKIAFGAKFIKKRICLEKAGFSKKYVFLSYFRLPRYEVISPFTIANLVQRIE